MIAVEQTKQMERLLAQREAFVVATVVRARRPTSVRPGDGAIVHRDGTIDGFVGGMCAESSVRLHSLRALETGEPLLLRLVPGDPDGEAGGGGAGSDDSDDGAVVERNPCLSGGSLEIFLEPHLPANRVVVVGGSPIARALAQLAAAAGYAAELVAAAEVVALKAAAAVVVASHGSGEEAVLAAALEAGVPYVALVASPKRGRAVRSALGVAPELAAQLHTPAGLDVGARTPAEIAISILAQMVAVQHAHPSLSLERDEPADRSITAEVEVMAPAVLSTAIDPVCGMRVAAVPATPHVQIDGETIWFCGEGCRESYAREDSLK
ncbi:MAG: XdhC family protein [Solirubrobacteraceae bacterium]